MDGDGGNPNSYPSPSESAKQHPIQQSFCRLLYSQSHWKCLLLTLLLVGCLSAIAWCKFSLQSHHPSPPSSNLFDPSYPYRSPGVYACEDSYIYIPIAFVIVIYIVYLVECWHCRIRHQLRGSVDARTVYDHVHALREALPIVWWKAVCYHYVRRSRQVARYRNGDAFTSTQVYYERVNSHVGTRAFDYTDCGVKDVSRRLADLEKFPSAKIRFTKRFSFATQEAEREFEQQRERFFSSCERRDDYMETREGVDFVNVNFREQMVVFADSRRLPWYVSSLVFWVASVLLLSWPIRVLIQYKTAYVHYFVHKVFGCNYLDAGRSGVQQRSLVREDTMESSELEMTIRSNYILVPSYSEALLMECPADGSSTVDTRQRFDVCQTGCINTSRLVASTSGSRSYGTVGISRNPLAQLRFPSGSVRVAEHARGRGRIEEGDALGGRPVSEDCSSSSNRSGFGCSRRWRRSYYEAVCFGASSSFTIDADDERVLARSRRSLAGSLGYARTMIAASASSPDSFAQKSLPLPASGTSYLVASTPHFAFGRPGSWSGVLDRLRETLDADSSSPSVSGETNPALICSPRSGERNLDRSPSSRFGERNPGPSTPLSDDTLSVVELPPSYEVALRMEQVHLESTDPALPHESSGLHSSSRDQGDDISVSTTSTYVSDSVHGTPRHQQQQQQQHQEQLMVASSSRKVFANTFTNPSVETTL